MQTEIVSKSELGSLTESLISNTKELGDSLESLKSTLSQARDYDGIDVTTAANILKNNLNVIMEEIDIASKNIKNYVAGIEGLDIDDFESQGGIFSLSNIKDNIADIFTFNTPNFIETSLNNAKINIGIYKDKILNGLDNIFGNNLSGGSPSIPGVSNPNLSEEDKLAIQYGFEPYRGTRLTAEMGVNRNGPTGPESWYNMDMTQGILPLMRQAGYTGEGVMGVNEYGAKTLDGLVMCAAYLKNRPKGTIVQTSLGVGIVVDTGSAFYPWDEANYKWTDPNHLEIATAWGNEWKA